MLDLSDAQKKTIKTTLARTIEYLSYSRKTMSVKEEGNFVRQLLTDLNEAKAQLE